MWQKLGLFIIEREMQKSHLNLKYYDFQTFRANPVPGHYMLTPVAH